MPPRYTARELIELLHADGWYFFGQEGSHKQYRHRTKPGKVTVPDHGSRTLAPGTVNGILRQAGLK